jgi:hypothetical protein
MDQDRNFMGEHAMDQKSEVFMFRVRRMEMLSQPRTPKEKEEYETWVNAAKANGATYA